MGDFDSGLEEELRRILDPIVASPIPLRRSALSGSVFRKVMGGAGAAVGAKVITGLAVAALAAGAAGAAAEFAITRSLNPVTWGEEIRYQVQSCGHGIGDCVSGFASQPQSLGSDQHKTGEASKSNQGGGPDVQGGGKKQSHDQEPSPQPTQRQDKNPRPTPKPMPPTCGDGSSETRTGC